MRGVKSKVLKSIIDYVYYGKAKVSKENLNMFMEIAEELKLKGLTRTEGESNLVEPEPPKPTSKLDSNESNQYSDQSLENKVTDLQSLIDAVKPMIGIGQTMGRKQRNNMCKDCGKEGAYTEIRNHIETKHVKGVSLPCDLCGKNYKTRNILGRHMKRHTDTD